MRIKVWLATAALVVLAGGSATVAAENPQQKKEMSAEEKAAMDAMMKAGMPGEGHKALNAMVGKWKATVKLWMAPDQPPAVSDGTMQSQWVLGGRWVEDRFSGEFMGQTFTGIGYTGYDNVSKQYVGAWMDTASTGLMTTTGTAENGGKLWKFTATMNDPMTGKPASSQMKVTVADADHHTMEMWGSGPDGKTYKVMEINYTRQK